MQRPITVLHIFSGDLCAGAEVMVFNLLNRLKEFPELKIFALSLKKRLKAKALITTLHGLVAVKPLI